MAMLLRECCSSSMLTRMKVEKDLEMHENPKLNENRRSHWRCRAVVRRRSMPIAPLLHPLTIDRCQVKYAKVMVIVANSSWDPMLDWSKVIPEECWNSFEPKNRNCSCRETKTALVHCSIRPMMTRNSIVSDHGARVDWLNLVEREK